MIVVKVKKRGKYYVIEYFIDGKRIRKSLGVKDEDTALLLASEFQSKILRNELNIADSEMLLTDAIKEYIDNACIQKSAISKAYDKRILSIFSNFMEDKNYEIKRYQRKGY